MDKRDAIYVQCVLSKGDLTQTTWLPKIYGVVGSIVKLKDDHGIWSDGWTVKYSSATELKEYQICGPRDPRYFRKLSRKV